MQLIRVPKGVENVDEFTISAWAKRQGDPIHKGDVILEALTDKASFQIEAEQDGVLRLILAPPKSTVPVGYIVGIVAQADEPLPDVRAENERILQERAAVLLNAAPAEPAPKAARAERAAGSARVAATPAARRRAREAGVPLEEIARHLGKAGVLNEKDVDAYLQDRLP